MRCCDDDDDDGWMRCCDDQKIEEELISQEAVRPEPDLTQDTTRLLDNYKEF